MNKYTPENIKIARSLALNIALFGGPDLTELDDHALVDRMISVNAALSLAAKKIGVTSESATHALKMLHSALNTSK